MSDARLGTAVKYDNVASWPWCQVIGKNLYSSTGFAVNRHLYIYRVSKKCTISFTRDVYVSAVFAIRQRGWLGGCLSVTSRYCIKTAKPILKLFRSSGSPIVLVFDSWHRYPIPSGTPSYPQNSPKVGTNRQFQAKRDNIKIAISRKILKRSTCNFKKMLGPSNTSRGWSAMTSYQI